MSGSTFLEKGRETSAGGGKEARRKRSRPVLALGLLAALTVLFLTTVASLAIGSGDVPFRDVVDGVLDPDVSVKGQLIVQEVRIPRTVAGLLAGAALGLAGTVMQGVARNPLADPQLLGVNAGASVAVVCSITLLGFTHATQFIWFGFLGALLA
ncbi:iron ABC transporter permease, partial [Streptomyces sp. CB02613]